MKAAVIGAFAVVVVLGTRVEGDQDSYCGYAFADTTGWARQAEGGFSFLLPPGFELLGRGGIDSQAARWARKDQRIFYDYGSYGNPLTEASMSEIEDYRQCATPLNGAARVVLFEKQGEGLGSSVGAFWENIAPPPFPVHLSMIGYSTTEELDSAAVSEYLSVLRSVRFEGECALEVSARRVANPETSTGTFRRGLLLHITTRRVHRRRVAAAQAGLGVRRD